MYTILTRPEEGSRIYTSAFLHLSNRHLLLSPVPLHFPLFLSIEPLLPQSATVFVDYGRPLRFENITVDEKQNSAVSPKTLKTECSN